MVIARALGARAIVIEPVLIANRGEIAVRIAAHRARGSGWRRVAGVHRPVDADAPHVDAADVAVADRLATSTRDGGRATRRAAPGARAVHPGYGFLSENAAFARAVVDGRADLGRPAAGGDRADGRQGAREGRSRARPACRSCRASRATTLARRGPRVRGEHGFPVVIKAVAGGGGKGMRVVRAAGELEGALGRRAARGAGRVRRRPRARRALPRAPAPHRDPGARRRARRASCTSASASARCSAATRRSSRRRRRRSSTTRCARAMGEAAVALARACGYEGAGTVEFIAPADASEFFFLEMNTRLQVEHPVTELVYGVDLVEQQLRVAAGEPLALEQAALRAARPRGRGAAVRRGPGQRLPARDRHGARATASRGRACASTPASARAAWSAPTTTRCSRR